MVTSDAIRASIRSMWTDRCKISRFVPVVQPNGATLHEAEVFITDEPCRISFSSRANNAATQTDNTANVSQSIKLFIDETLDIPAGSKVEIARGGRLFRFECSGHPAVYDHHQEINLTAEVTIA